MGLRSVYLDWGNGFIAEQATQATRMKNKVSGLSMEVGAAYHKQQLQGRQYFTELADTSGGCWKKPNQYWPPINTDKRGLKTRRGLKSIRDVGPVTWFLNSGSGRPPAIFFGGKDRIWVPIG